MANETTTTSANDFFLAAQVDSLILDEIRPYSVSRPFFRYARLTQSSAHDFPVQDDPGAAVAKVEGTDLTNTSLTTSKATASASTVGMMATVTDELSRISIVDAYEHFGSVLTRSAAEKYETDFTALVDDFSNTTSTTTIDATVAKFIEAKGALIARDAVGTLVAILHPVQTTDLSQDAATSLSAAFANPSVQVNGLMSNALAGFAFELAGVPVYQTSLVPTANAAADRAGGIFVSNVALGMAEVWDTRTELQRDASNVATEIVVTARYGLVEIRDAWGQTLITDA